MYGRSKASLHTRLSSFQQGPPPLMDSPVHRPWPILPQSGSPQGLQTGICPCSMPHAFCSRLHRSAAENCVSCGDLDATKVVHSGQGGYITLAASGIPTASERGAKSEVAHKWAGWLHHPCRLREPHRFRAGGKIRSGP